MIATPAAMRASCALALLLVTPATAADPPAPRSVTLAALLAEARQASPRLRVAHRTVGVSEAGVRVAVQRIKNPEIELRRTTGSPFGDDDMQSFEVGLFQELQTGGQRGSRGRVARVARDRARQEALSIERTVQAEVAETFYRVLTARQRRGLLSELAGLTDAIARTAQVRWEAGEIARTEVNLALVGAQRTHQEVLAVEADLAREVVELARMVGRDSLDPEAIDGAWPAIESSDPEDPIVAAALAGRPERRAAEAAVHEASAQIELERAQSRPDLRLGLVFERSEGDVGPAGQERIKKEETLGLVLSTALPIVYRRRGEVEQARARVEEARAGLEAVERAIRRDVLSARRTLEIHRRRLADYQRDLVTLARANRELALRGYEAGELGTLEVLRAQEDEARVRLGELEARRDATLAWIALRTSLGEAPLPPGP